MGSLGISWFGGGGGWMDGELHTGFIVERRNGVAGGRAFVFNGKWGNVEVTLDAVSPPRPLTLSKLPRSAHVVLVHSLSRLFIGLISQNAV